MFKNALKPFIGWPASIALFAADCVAEWTCRFMGGNLGPFMWVTLHFIIMPILSAALLVLICVRVFAEKGVKRKLILFGSVSLPSLIILLALRTDPGTLKLFGPFQH